MKRQRSNHSQEGTLVTLIDLKTQCKRELKEWLATVKKKEFGTSIKLQNHAALIARGIAIKMKSLRAQDLDDNELLEMAADIARTYGKAWEQQAQQDINLHLDGSLDQRITGTMNINALKEAIKRDQEER